MRPSLVIWGASGHARVVADIIRLQGTYEIAGFLEDAPRPRPEASFLGLPVFGGTEALQTLLARGVRHLILGFGDGHARLRLASLLRERGFSLATAIHPRAVVADDARIGEGTVVAAGAVVNPAARVGENVIINTGATVDHDCVIEDGAHVCPGAHLAGNVQVGRAAWVGIGAAVVERVRIGAGALVGAGAVVVADIPPAVVAHGVPARIIRTLAANEAQGN